MPGFEINIQDQIEAQSEANQQEFKGQIERLVSEDDVFQFVPTEDVDTAPIIYGQPHPAGHYVAHYLLPNGSLLEISQPEDYDLGGYHDGEVHEPNVNWAFTIYENGRDLNNQPWVIRRQFEYETTWEKPKTELNLTNPDSDWSLSDWENAEQKTEVRCSTTALTAKDIGELAKAKEEDDRAYILGEVETEEVIEANVKYFMGHAERQEAQRLAGEYKSSTSALTNSELQDINALLAGVKGKMSIKSLGLESLLDN